MDLPLQITVRGLTHSQRLDAAIRRRAAKLEKLHPQLKSCRVVVEQPSPRQQSEFKVRLDLHLRGDRFAVTRDHHEDPYVALREAFQAATRKLGDHLQRRKGR